MIVEKAKARYFRKTYSIRHVGMRISSLVSNFNIIRHFHLVSVVLEVTSYYICLLLSSALPGFLHVVDNCGKQLFVLGCSEQIFDISDISLFTNVS